MRISDWRSDVCSSDLLWVQLFLPRKAPSASIALFRPICGRDLHSDGEKSDRLENCTCFVARTSTPHKLIIIPKPWVVDTLVDNPRDRAGPGIGRDQDRKSVVQGKSVSGRVDLGGRRN